jgi:hypothetical protein
VPMSPSAVTGSSAPASPGTSGSTSFDFTRLAGPSTSVFYRQTFPTGYAAETAGGGRRASTHPPP